MDWVAVQNILLWVPGWDGTIPTPAIIAPKPLWTGKHILRLAIPSGINIVRKSDPPAPNPMADNGMLIENGEILYGIVAKPIIGSAQGGLSMSPRKGPGGMLRTLQRFTNDCELLVVVPQRLQYRHWCGIGDTIANEPMMDHISNHIATVYKVIERGQ